MAADTSSWLDAMGGGDTGGGDSGPTGIPDPRNPGYDTAGYPLSGGTAAPPAPPNTGGSWATGTPQANGVTPTFTPAPGSGQTPVTNGAGQTWGAGGPSGNFDTAGNPMSFGGGYIATDPAPPGDGLLAMFHGAAPSFVGANVGPAPVFTPPAFTPPPAFKDPTAAEAAAEPGYDFALKQGLGSVEAAAAAKGVLNTGGTLKDIFDYGSHAATQNYQNVDNRARNNYQLNYQTQNVDPYMFAYKSAYDAFQPRMAQYAAENNVSQFNAGQANNLNFNDWLQQYNIFRNRQLDTINANTATS